MGAKGQNQSQSPNAKAKGQERVGARTQSHGSEAEYLESGKTGAGLRQDWNKAKCRTRSRLEQGWVQGSI